MGRSHGSSRQRATLLLAALALVAIALIPRGVVRTTLAIADESPSTTQSTVTTAIPSVGHAETDDAELPGVRALVAREERDASIHHSAGDDALAADAAAPTDDAGEARTLSDHTGPTPSPVPANTADSRAPPVLS